MGKNNLTERVRGIITAARTQTLEYEPRPDPVIDWSAYDAAKTQELPDVLRLIRRFVDTAAANLKPAGHTIPPMGRCPTPPADVAKALLTQAYLDKANRVAEGFADAFGPRLGIASGSHTKQLNEDTQTLVYKPFLMKYSG